MRRGIFAVFALVASLGLFLPSVASADPVTHSVSGTLTNTCDPLGNPVGVWMVVWNGATQVASATTGPGGVYTIAGVPPGSYTVSPYAPAGCGSVPNSTPVDLTSADATGIDFEMVKVFSIFGQVTGCPEDEGVGTPDVTVNLLDGGNQIASTTTDNFGDYFFQYKPAKDGYTVEVAPGAGCGADSPSVPVNLSVDDVEGVDFAFIRDCSSGNPGSMFGSIFGSLGSSEFCFS
ncbi:carboxypeptidase-like regulatory domain-containing protein [Rhodococcus sp. IEGM 1379]|uniref:carboxypeptidase-like regulatory domain-containing protein n=1 Tax=Rhodococcus sp. IEGM 1379 TaxID=3047086 RepID=UPI0024B6CF3B|nr:carboxypeptidase-like regulatory domain-containing protein [Rhodococcus sp. IEGM 1379]MDI9915013.1 carboxypeptidase-like regulatory domain-containing protein [Rhodococcus sp. IEGM 1379]